MIMQRREFVAMVELNWIECVMNWKNNYYKKR